MWCPETESNRHVLLRTRDFKSRASASFAIRATGYNARILQQLLHSFHCSRLCPQRCRCQFWCQSAEIIQAQVSVKYGLLVAKSGGSGYLSARDPLVLADFVTKHYGCELTSSSR